MHSNFTSYLQQEYYVSNLFCSSVVIFYFLNIKKIKIHFIFIFISISVYNNFDLLFRVYLIPGLNVKYKIYICNWLKTCNCKLYEYMNYTCVQSKYWNIYCVLFSDDWPVDISWQPCTYSGETNMGTALGCRIRISCASTGTFSLCTSFHISCTRTDLQILELLKCKYSSKEFMYLLKHFRGYFVKK